MVGLRVGGRVSLAGRGFALLLHVLLSNLIMAAALSSQI